jgi:hypothetical protein
MDYFVYLDGRQQGPLTKEQLQTLNITRETPVWYEGLQDWKPAGEAEGTAWLFTQQTPPQFQQQQPQYQQNYQQTYQPPQYQQAPQQQYQQPQYQQTPQEDMPPCPDNNLAWAIITTVLCCLPFGIVAIIKAASVNDKYNRGDYQGAVDAAKAAANWSIAAACTGVVVGIISFASQMFLAFL